MTDAVILCEMSTEDQQKIIQAWLNGEPLELYGFISKKWLHISPLQALNKNEAYRIKEIKPSIDWNAVHEDYKWLAVDQNQKAWIYKNKPVMMNVYWDAIGESKANVFSSLDIGDCHWKESLVQRPEGE